MKFEEHKRNEINLKGDLTCFSFAYVQTGHDSPPSRTGIGLKGRSEVLGVGCGSCAAIILDAVTLSVSFISMAASELSAISPFYR